MSIDMLRQQRHKRRMKKWITWAMMAEAFFIALSPSLATISLMVGILLTVWRFRTVKDVQFRHLPFDVPLALFVFLGAASIVVSPNHEFSFYNYYNLVGVYALTYLLIGQNVRDAEQVRKIVMALGASAALVVLYGFYQYIFGIDISEMRWVDGQAFPELTTRVFSTWENPNILAGYLDAVLCVLLGFFMKSGNRVQKAFLVLGMVLVAACLAMTYARGACLAIAIVFLGYGLFKDWRIFLACLVVGGAVLLLDATLYERILSVFTKMDTSSEMRLAFWEATVAMIEDHPFLGIGWGAYWMVYPEYDFYMQGAPIKIVHAHNIYLNYMAEIGIAGAVAFFWYFFGTMFLCLRAKIFSEPEPVAELVFDKAIEDKTIEDKEEQAEADGQEEKNASAEEQEDGKEEDAPEDGEEDAAELKDAGAEEKSGKDEGIGQDAEMKLEAAADDAADSGEEASSEESKEEKEDAEPQESADDAAEDDVEDSEEEDEAEDAEDDAEDSEDEDEAEDAAKSEKEDEAGHIEEKNEEEKEESEEPSEKSEENEEGEESEEENVEEKEFVAEEEKGEEASQEAATEDEESTEPEEKEEDGQEPAVTEDASSIWNAEAEPEPEETGTWVGNLVENWRNDWGEAKIWEDRRIRAGLSLGIGLAFVSVALNGLTDDLLFNIPSSMLLWLLAALGAVNADLEEEDS